MNKQDGGRAASSPGPLSNLRRGLIDALFPEQRRLQITASLKPQPLTTEEPEPKPGFMIGTVPETKEPIYALGPQLDRHLLIIGGTGSGKTTLIARLFTEEILKWQ